MTYNPSQFKDYGKLNKLIHCFDPALEVSMYAENKPSRLDTKFMVACSARHTDEKYGKEIEGVDGYGEYSIDETGMPKIIWEKLFNSWINRKFFICKKRGK